MEERFKAWLGAPIAGEEPGDDLRTLVFRHAIHLRTQFLRTFKEARYSERDGYSNLLTAVRHLIDHTQSSEGPRSSSRFSKSTGPTTTNTPSEAETDGTKAADGPAEPANEGEQIFVAELRLKFAAAGKGVPTPRQCDQTLRALRTAELVPDGFIAFLTPEKTKRVSHPGVLPALVEEYIAMAGVAERERAEGEARKKRQEAESLARWRQQVAEQRAVLADPVASEEAKQWAREALGTLGAEEGI